MRSIPLIFTLLAAPFLPLVAALAQEAAPPTNLNFFAHANSQVQSLENIESDCRADSDCLAIGPTAPPFVSSLNNTLAFRGKSFNFYKAAIANDGVSPVSLRELREKERNNPSFITSDERAVLVAANRIGWVKWPECGLEGNAFLVQIKDGQDSILTSRHQLVRSDTGKPKRAGCDFENSIAYYYPDISYMNDNNFNSDLSLRAIYVNLDDRSLRAVLSGYAYSPSEDFIVLDLHENASSEVALDGRLRGYLSFFSDGHGVVQGFYLGFNSDYTLRTGLQEASYQECSIDLSRGTHACDTLDGTSSSLIGVVENGELKAFSLHTRKNTSSQSFNINNTDEWNVGTPVANIIRHYRSDDDTIR